MKNITLKIQSGESIGIVGRIGRGKTTLVNSLLRIYNVNEESVFIDGVDIMKIDLKSLREIVAYVPHISFDYEVDKTETAVVSNREEQRYINARIFNFQIEKGDYDSTIC